MSAGTGGNPPDYACDPCPCINGDLNGDGEVTFADLNPFVATVDGATGVQMTYVWNAENRLVEVRPTAGAEVAGSVKVTFAYDYRGRRIEKKVYDWDEPNGVWEDAPSLCRKFIWSGWKLLMELECEQPDCGTGFQPVRSYTWGLDLAGQNGQVNSLEGAGTIGGLLAMCDQTTGTDGNAVYLYDGNGNVTQLIAWAADFGGTDGYAWDTDPSTQPRLLAHYEYDPYGNVVNDLSAYAYAEANPFRFSTHQFDSETGLIYAKGRHYEPRSGRWLSRDPIGEDGGTNLYAYVGNGPPNIVDPLGLEECGGPIRCAVPDGSCTLWPPSPPSGFPELPSHTTFSYPVITSKPGWWWGLNPGCSYYRDVAYDPYEGFGLTMRNLPATKGLLKDAKDDLKRKLKYDCVDCCKNEGTVHSATYIDGLAGTASVDKYKGKAPGRTWWHVGSFRLRYFAHCNVAVTCDGCKASCAITYDVWDGWHWGASPGTSCSGFNQFNWHVTWYCVDFITSPCSDKPASSRPTTQAGASR